MTREPRPLGASGLLARLRSFGRRVLRDPRVFASIAAGALVVAFAVLAIASGRAPDVRGIVDVTPDATATAAVAPSPVLPATFSPIPEQTPVPPGQTPEGVNRIAQTSAPISPLPPASPTPTPDPAVWRFEGAVVDADGKPLKGVCVIIGPHGCRPGSIRTDDHGRYYVDMPQNPTVVYDLYFASEGFEVVWHRAQPSGPTVFNVVLRRL